MIQELEVVIGDSCSVYLVHTAAVGLNGILRLDPAGFILSVFVHEDSRGWGIGAKLIERACALCAERGCESIGLSVADNNPRARQLYRRLGFIKYVEGHEGHTQFVRPLPATPVSSVPAVLVTV